MSWYAEMDGYDFVHEDGYDSEHEEEERRKKSKVPVVKFWMDLQFMMVWMSIMMQGLVTLCSRRRGLTSRYVLQFQEHRNNIFRLVYQDDSTCHHLLRMNRARFNKLCQMLKTIGRLNDTNNKLADEHVAMFLHIIAHYAKNRVIRNIFGRSAKVISRHYHNVLNVVLRLQSVLLKRPEPILADSTNYRW